ncbi:hypothetical protein BGZ99_010219, partial [Dissophora globulifera]
TFAVGRNDGTINVYDTASWVKIHTLQGHTDRVSSVTYSPNGYQIASSSNDDTMRLWDAQTGAPGLIFSGHIGSISSVTYSPNGHKIISASYDETARLWDVASGQCLVVVDDVRGSIRSIALSATLNGFYFATGSGNFVRTWEVIEEEDQFRVQLLWYSAHSGLSVSGTLIQDTQGLSRINIQLLRQRGAVGNPTQPLSLREASWKIAGVASVASRLKVPENIGTPREL